MFFLESVAEQAADAADRARHLQDLQTDWRRQAQSVRHVSGLTLALVDYLFEQPILSATGVQKRFGVSAPGALKMLRRLEELGIVHEATGKQRGRTYVAREVLQVVS